MFISLLNLVAALAIPAGTFLASKAFVNYWKQIETDPVKLNEAERNTAGRNAGDQFVNFNDVVETFACHLPQGSRLRFENSQFYIEDKYGAPLKPTSSRALKPVEQMAISHDNLVSISKIVYDIVPIGDPNAYSKDERLAELGIPLPKGFNPQKEPTQVIKFNEPDMQVKADENTETLKNETEQVKASAKHLSDMVGMNSSEFAEASKSLQDVMLKVASEKPKNRDIAELKSAKVIAFSGDDSVYFYKQKEDSVASNIIRKSHKVEEILEELCGLRNNTCTRGYFVGSIKIFAQELFNLTLSVVELEQELLEEGLTGNVYPENLMFLNNKCNEIEEFVYTLIEYRERVLEINKFYSEYEHELNEIFFIESEINQRLRCFRITFENLIRYNKA